MPEPVATVTVAYCGWDDDPGWYEDPSPYGVRRRVPADLWQRYQHAVDAAQAAQEVVREISDELGRAGEEIPAACRHANMGHRWSVEDGLRAVCACGEEFPWSGSCPHSFYSAVGDRDMCGMCGANLPYVTVPLVGGPKDGETTRFHGEWSPGTCQVMLIGDDLNYRLRNDEDGLRYVFSEPSGSRAAS